MGPKAKDCSSSQPFPGPSGSLCCHPIELCTKNLLELNWGSDEERQERLDPTSTCAFQPWAMLRARTGTPAAPQPKSQHGPGTWLPIQARLQPSQVSRRERSRGHSPLIPPWPPLNLARQPPSTTNPAPGWGENQPGPRSLEKRGKGTRARPGVSCARTGIFCLSAIV